MVEQYKKRLTLEEVTNQLGISIAQGILAEFPDVKVQATNQGLAVTYKTPKESSRPEDTFYTNLPFIYRANDKAYAIRQQEGELVIDEIRPHTLKE